MEFDQPPDERQAEDGAFVAADDPVVDLAATRERDSDVLRRHADAGIGHDDGDIASAPFGAQRRRKVRRDPASWLPAAGSATASLPSRRSRLYLIDLEIAQPRTTDGIVHHKVPTDRVDLQGDETGDFFSAMKDTKSCFTKSFADCFAISKWLRVLPGVVAQGCGGMGGHAR